MRRKITLATVMALLLGLLLSLSGAALQSDEVGSAVLTPQGLRTRTLQEEDETLVFSFLQALADELGLSVDELEEAVQAAKDEVIGRWVGRWAQLLKERLSQVEPRDLLGFMMEHPRPFQELRERLGQRMIPFREEFWQRRLLGPIPRPLSRERYMPPYYQPFPYNCVCYCNFPYYLPPQPQPELLPWPWKLPQPQPKWPQPEQESPQQP